VVLNNDELCNLENTKAILKISALNGKGIDKLISQLKKLYSANIGEVKISVSLLKRHHGHLVRASDSLADAISAVEILLAPDAVALDLRKALEEILSITGEYYDDTLLNEIFSNFCVGK
ncbi:hypothetical protein KKB99_04405, partial [bacterium]|nr:hypothetical protein [bacterium]MBU1025236.1 hypothetical protein [bacterium]